MGNYSHNPHDKNTDYNSWAEHERENAKTQAQWGTSFSGDSAFRSDYDREKQKHSTGWSSGSSSAATSSSTSSASSSTGWFSSNPSVSSTSSLSDFGSFSISEKEFFVACLKLIAGLILLFVAFTLLSGMKNDTPAPAFWIGLLAALGGFGLAWEGAVGVVKGLVAFVIWVVQMVIGVGVIAALIFAFAGGNTKDQLKQPVIAQAEAKQEVLADTKKIAIVDVKMDDNISSIKDADKRLNIRSCPVFDKIKCPAYKSQLRQGALVTILGGPDDNGWYEIEALSAQGENLRGYVNSKHLRF